MKVASMTLPLAFAAAAHQPLASDTRLDERLGIRVRVHSVRSFTPGLCRVWRESSSGAPAKTEAQAGKDRSISPAIGAASQGRHRLPGR